MKKIAKYFVLFWVLINLIIFIGSGNFFLKKDNSVFFPFGQTIEKHYVYSSEIVKNAMDINDYDYTEFLAYVIIPAFMLAIVFRNSLINFFKKYFINEIKSIPGEINKSVSYLDDSLESKNGQMYKQRIGILIAAAIGALATFLPWVHAPIIGSVPGSSGSDGWITFILFAIAIGVVFIGNKEKPLNPGLLIGAVIPGILAAIVGLWKIIDFNSKMSGADSDNPLAKALTQTTGIGIGLYLVVLAGIAVVVAGFVLTKSGSNSSDPLESKKE